VVSAVAATTVPPLLHSPFLHQPPKLPELLLIRTVVMARPAVKMVVKSRANLTVTLPLESVSTTVLPTTNVLQPMVDALQSAHLTEVAVLSVMSTLIALSTTPSFNGEMQRPPSLNVTIMFAHPQMVLYQLLFQVFLQPLFLLPMVVTLMLNVLSQPLRVPSLKANVYLVYSMSTVLTMVFV